MTRRGAKLVVHVLGTLVGLATIALAGAAWRLAQGPIALGAMTPYIEAALNEQDTGYYFEIGDAELAWGDWQRAFDLRVLDVRVTHDAGLPAMVAGEVILEMALPPLVRGELRPRAITVIHPTIAARREEDGSISFSMLPQSTAGQAAVPAGGILSGAEFVEGFLDARDRPPFDRLNRVAVLGADLTIDDRELGLVWNAPAAELVLERRGEGLDFSARMTLRAGEHKIDTDLVAVYQPDEDVILISSRLTDFALADLSDLVPAVPPLEGLDVAVDGELTLALDSSLHVVNGSFAVSATGGHVDLPRVFEAPFDIGPSRASGQVGRNFSRIEIAALDLDLGLERSAGTVVIGGFEPDSVIEARLEVAGLPVEDLGRFWPVKLVPRARDWLTSHLDAGLVTRGVLGLHATVAELSENTMPLENLAIDVDVTGAVLTYLPGLPPVTGITAGVVIADDKLRVDVSSGVLNGLQGSRGVVTMDGLSGENGMLIGAEASGEVRKALEILSDEDLGLTALVGLAPEEIGGRIEGRLEILLPRLSGLEREDIRFRVAADLSDLALTTDLRGYRVDGGSGTLVFDSRTALFEGGVRLDGVPFEIDYRQSFRADDPVRRTVQLRGRVDDADREALGMPELVDMEGPVGVVLDLAQTSTGTMVWSAVADLTPAVIAYPLLGLDKPAGEPGRAALRMVDDLGPVLKLEAVELSVDSTAITGSGALRATDFSLMRLDFQRLAFGRNELTGAVSVREDSLFDVVLSGGTADLEPFLEDLTSAGGPTMPPFRIQGRLDGVWLTEDDLMTDVRLEGTYLEDRWEALAVTGMLDGTTPTSLNIWRFSPEERRFEYVASDAGDAIRAVGLFDHADGGSLEVRARIDDADPDRPSIGAMRATDFVMTESPILAQILSFASLGGLANALSGEGLAFENALIPFEKRGDLVTISDGRAYGPGLGLTVFGTVDLGSDQLDLDGTIVPIYQLNAALGEIPLIGDILTGFEEGGGLFGFTYEVTGPRDAPEISVDPLSLLAPGILRRLFEAPSDAAVDGYSFGGSRTEGGR